MRVEFKHFGLKRNPFGHPKEPSDLIRTRSVAQIIAAMHQAVKEREILCITGPIGSGKSRAVEKGKLELQKMGIEVIEILAPDNKHVSFFSGMQALLEHFHVPTRMRYMTLMLEAIRREMGEALLSGREFCIIIDEAQSLSERLLKGLKRFSELDYGPYMGGLCGLVLVGQDSLLSEYRMKARDFYLRIHGHRMLEVALLTPKEIENYIHQRIEACGGNRKIFSSSAALAIAKRVRTPILVNEVAYKALFRAYLAGDKVISSKHVGEVEKDQLQNLQEFLITSGMSLDELARAANVPKSTLREIYRGQYHAKGGSVKHAQKVISAVDRLIESKEGQALKYERA